MRKFLAFMLFLILALPIALDVSTPSVYGNDQNDPGAVYVLDPDTTTKGDWIEVYGRCAYILPNTTMRFQVATGETTPTSLGQQDIYWREYWSILGLTESPYEDYIGGRIGVNPCGPIQYELIGPNEGPRTLVNCLDLSGNPTTYRPGVWRHPSSFTVTLSNVPSGSYRLALYFQDWGILHYDHEQTKLNVEVSTPDYGSSAMSNIENFFSGVYVKFDVEISGSHEINIMITKTNVNADYAKLSGIFLDTSSHSGAPVFNSFDWVTNGNWRYVYGNYYYNLAAINCNQIPTDLAINPMNSNYDENSGPPISYSFSSDVEQYAAADAETLPTYPLIGQYAAYTWTLDAPDDDIRVLEYPDVNPYCDYPPPHSGNRIYGQWDTGEEGYNLNYLMINLTLPPNWFNMSLYFLDYGQLGRSETLEIFDETMTPLITPIHISSSDINAGIYEKFQLYGGRTIFIKVTADPGKLNAFIDGLFLDSLSLWSSDINGDEKNEFDWMETVYVTLPSITGVTVDVYVLKDQATWSYGDPLDDVSDRVDLSITFTSDGYETHQVWGPPLVVDSYDIIEDRNRNGVFDAGDRIDSCNVTIGFFVIPEIAGTLTALLATIIALTLFRARKLPFFFKNI